MEQADTSVRRPLLSSLMLVALTLAVHGQQKPGDHSISGPASACQRVAIIGEVHTPGRFEFQANLHLQKLVECAGGLTDKAGKNLYIVHAGDAPPCGSAEQANLSKRDGPVREYQVDFFSLAAVVRGDAASNPLIRPGDIISVPQFDNVFVVGAVLQPQSIPLKGPLLLTQAIALAGGVSRDGQAAQIKITRAALGSSARAVFIVDLKAIAKHRAEDIPLQPFDIIEVPENSGVRWMKTILIGQSDFLGSLPWRSIC